MSSHIYQPCSGCFAQACCAATHSVNQASATVTPMERAVPFTMLIAASMLAARGWTNQEIADHMGVSPNTVKSYVSSSLQKLGISRRRDLMAHMLA